MDHTFYAARISAVEVVAALLLRVRTGSLSLSLVQQTIEVFKTEFYVYYQIAEITASLVERAMKLVEIHPLKGYDAVQLAAAITLNQARISRNLSPITFICADARLNQAAQSQGLTVENPNDH